MGPTGSGKSSFLSAVTGEDMGRRHGPSSHSGGIHAIRVRVPEHGVNFVFVVAPGFDDKRKLVNGIFKPTSDWLKEMQSRNLNLSHILYLRCISDNGLAGAPWVDIVLFDKIRMHHSCKNVVLVTTMWNELDGRGIGTARERKLKDTFWKPLLDRRCTLQRHDGTTDSAWDIIHHVLVKSKRQQRPLS
ncbi:hypothetical protein Agabi119p4_6061 [Agaricus bisporus var. burnettii]|uniref:G domain-containing protein n=1 Tax=Agaricus bisporus var. burnettii TaxID=192524 RepID=A0A8H7KG44_AGABI|nr:hypothetical protein Agabi119p4_6061 [Agaricus bisporus var. burnettii]